MLRHNKKGVMIFLAGMLSVLLLQSGVELLSNLRYQMTGNASPGSYITNQKIDKINKLIKDEFLFEADKTKMTEGMYAGLVSGLEDQYSEYYTAEEYYEINATHEGHYKGIGIVMIQDKRTGTVTVGHCYENSPAKKAGVLEGDIIYKVDDEIVADQELNDVAAAIKTGKADEVHITLYRESEQRYIEVTIIKEDIEIPVVETEMLEDQIGYVAIYQFTGVTASQFQEGYQELLKQGAKSLIIDLRNNPGGLLSGVCDTLDCFMPEGLLVYTEDKNGDGEQYFAKGDTPIEIPLVVLVNENSASASEIFAGAVKDHNVGTLVGTTTFGKGIVQKSFGLGDGSVVKLTVSSYFTPNGENIHGTGVTPDVEVEQPDDGKTDAQFEKAIEIAREKCYD